MKQLIGFILIWIAIGMIIMYMMSHGFVAIMTILVLLILGYKLFC